MTKLNLCCGTNVFPGWINLDHTDVEADYLRHLREADPCMQWPAEQQALVDRIGEIQFMRHDVRKGLPWPDGSVDAIYIGQAIEHFNRRTEAPALLRECARVLRQYGVIKLTTPDLSTLFLAYYNTQERGGDDLDRFASEQPDFYSSAEADDQLSYLLFGAAGEKSTNQNYEGHHHCYTWRSLAHLLEECKLWPLRKESGAFSDCIDKGMSHSFCLEGVKP